MKELWLFTRQFPSGTGEVFLENALPVWRKCFRKVRVFPMFTGKGVVEVPEGVVVERLWDDPFATTALPLMVKRPSRLLRLLAARGHGARSVQGGARGALSHSRQLLFRMEALERRLDQGYDPERVLMLSAWMEDWATLLAMSRAGGRRLRFDSMVHRTDLFEGGEHGPAIPYRRLQLQQVDRVLCIAEDGMAELRNGYPEHADKLMLVRLGTPDHGPGPWAPAGELRLVSCSYVVPRKRVERIAEVLAHVERPVHWTHFGDGPSRAVLDEAVSRLPEHVRVDLRGATPNAEVLHTMATTPFDLFVHLSAHEGLPVALMEAASFGIPLLAVDAGGVCELVGPDTGHLLPADAPVPTISAWLNGPGPERLCDPRFRERVRRSWQELFEAEQAYGRIARSLTGWEEVP